MWTNVSDSDKIAFERRVRQVDLEAEHEQHEQHQLDSLVPLSEPSPTGKIFCHLNTHSFFLFHSCCTHSFVHAAHSFVLTQSRKLLTHFFSFGAFAALAKAFAGDEFGQHPRGCGLNSG